MRNHCVTRSLINLGCVPHAHNLDNKLKGAVMLYLMEGVKASFAVYLVNAIVSMRCVEEASLCEVCGAKEATLSWPRCNHVFCEVCFWKNRVKENKTFETLRSGQLRCLKCDSLFDQNSCEAIESLITKKRVYLCFELYRMYEERSH